MSALSAWAEKVAAAAARIEADLAIEVARAQSKDFLAIERAVTPKKTGRLAESEAVDGVSGGGTHAVGVVSPHIIYAEFRNDGGTISAHAGLGRMGLRPHTLHWDGGGFPLHVTQKGAHYVQKAEAIGRGALTGTAEVVIAGFLDF